MAATGVGERIVFLQRSAEFARTGFYDKKQSLKMSAEVAMLTKLFMEQGYRNARGKEVIALRRAQLAEAVTISHNARMQLGTERAPEAKMPKASLKKVQRKQQKSCDLDSDDEPLLKKKTKRKLNKEKAGKRKGKADVSQYRCSAKWSKYDDEDDDEDDEDEENKTEEEEVVKTVSLITNKRIVQKGHRRGCTQFKVRWSDKTVEWVDQTCLKGKHEKAKINDFEVDVDKRQAEADEERKRKEEALEAKEKEMSVQNIYDRLMREYEEAGTKNAFILKGLWDKATDEFALQMPRGRKRK